MDQIPVWTRVIPQDLSAEHLFRLYADMVMGTGATPEDLEAGLVNSALGLTGEAGEVADMIKKYLFQGHPLSHEKLFEELGDILWYVQFCALLFGIPLAEIMVRNMVKLQKRYPNGSFSVEDSIARKDRLAS